ncbi:DnaJ sub C member 7 [Aphanomyces cochlioides]|nr:DnaJ sub C member 7 [Aphanomyces cochlioides]
MVTPTSPSNSSVDGSMATKKRKVGVPKFLRYLYQILDKEDSSIISWANNGSSIQILDTDRMAQYILPKYFKHSKYASFQRQLNYFGFRKWTKSQTNICTFSHPEFRQNRPDRLYLIKRKNSPESARKKLPTVKSSADKLFTPLLHLNDFLVPSFQQRLMFPTEFDMKQEFQPHAMGDIENLNIQTDSAPNFNLLDMSPMCTPAATLPDIKDSDAPFDFDMNCTWLDGFNPSDPVNNAFGQPEFA